jgi:leader peptidase (prepilin peptidase)/N-methyltransferase
MNDNSWLPELIVRGPLGWIAATFWGLAWGSFFNVLIVRVPERESLWKPGSHCRSCKAPISWYDNIPVISYLVLRGRCRACKARVSPRYLLVEVTVAALVLLVYCLFVVSAAATPIGLRLARFVVVSLFVGFLVAFTFIDVSTRRVPDIITGPAIPVCMGFSLLMGHPRWWDGLVGGVGGYLLVGLVTEGYRLITGRDGMGWGDAKLLAMIGGLMGWQVLLPVLFLSALQGTVIGIPLLCVVRARRPRSATDAQDRGDENEHVPLRHAALPFAPFLSLATLEVLLIGDRLRAFFPLFYNGCV